MSILFEALNRAARAYRVRQEPVAIRLVEMPVAEQRLAVRLGKLAFIILIVVVSFVFVLRLSPSTPSHVPSMEKEISSFDSSAPMADTKTNKDADSIEVEASSLDPSVQNDEKVSAIADALQTVPVLQAHELPSDSASDVVIDDEEEAQLAAEPEDEALQNGQWGKAIGLYSQRLKQQPQDHEAMKGLAYALEHRGLEKDSNYLDALCERYPDRAVFFAAKGRLLAAQNDTKEAIYTLRRAVELDKGDAETALALAILYDKAGEEKDALRLYQSLPPPLDPSVKARLDYLAERVLLRQAKDNTQADEPEEE